MPNELTQSDTNKTKQDKDLSEDHCNKTEGHVLSLACHDEIIDETHAHLQIFAGLSIDWNVEFSDLRGESAIGFIYMCVYIII